jgi:hypothetical protein
LAHGGLSLIGQQRSEGPRKSDLGRKEVLVEVGENFSAGVVVCKLECSTEVPCDPQSCTAKPENPNPVGPDF